MSFWCNSFRLRRVHHITVKISFRIAGALMGQAKKAAANWGVKTMWLATHETNRRAQKLYKRYGFKNAGKRSFKVGSTTCRDVVMVASL